MRNVFDQYKQPENRLTHALLCALNEDRRLLLAFVREFLKDKSAKPPFQVLEQSLPGDQGLVEREEADLDGQPDGCIVDRDGRAWLIESKIASRPNADQLVRHQRTAARHGLSKANILNLTTGRVVKELVADSHSRTWSELYKWLHEHAQRSRWAGLCARYFEAAEIRFPREGYPYEGTLTVFTGIPFDSETPYNYAEAKRLLELLRKELRSRPSLDKALGADPLSSGRKAVTGSRELMVWDYISLKRARGNSQHTKFPHLTLGVNANAVEAFVTIPNSVGSTVRSRLFDVERSSFVDRVEQTTRGIAKAIRGSGGTPWIVVVQRRYKTQRSAPFVDASLRFDPRTAFDSIGITKPRIKPQPQWLDAVHSAMAERNSNLQFQIGAEFMYRQCPVVRTREIVDVIERVWLACAPFVNPD